MNVPIVSDLLEQLKQINLSLRILAYCISGAERVEQAEQHILEKQKE